jgi:hypothetical protein
MPDRKPYKGVKLKVRFQRALMPEFCTCGTKLVEDARFCHRCGRPTSEEFIEATPAAPPPTPPTIQDAVQAKIAQLPVNFSNPIAIRVALLMSVVIIPVELMPFLNLLSFVWWLGAGWCAVLLYRRLTGSVLSIRAGARLGSITGVLTFLGYAILLTIGIVAAGNEFVSQIEKQNPDVSQVIHDPTMLFAVIMLGMALLFALVVAICAAGGALGARFAARGKR